MFEACLNLKSAMLHQLAVREVLNLDAARGEVLSKSSSSKQNPKRKIFLMSIRSFFFVALAAVFALSLTVMAAPPITSVYSSLSGCKMVKTGQGQGEDWSVMACRGIAGYSLQLEYGDARESITVFSPDRKKHPLELWQVISSGFSSVGQKAEWRVTTKNGKQVPLALIVRFNASENPEDSSKVTSYLVVAKITPQKICVTDKIAPGATQNEEARRAADASADKPCIEAP
jgi:hypothetical protein